MGGNESTHDAAVATEEAVEGPGPELLPPSDTEPDDAESQASDREGGPEQLQPDGR